MYEKSETSDIEPLDSDFINQKILSIHLIEQGLLD